jgi:hypothetical protein
VISLPSPTHSNFIVSASTTGVPGRVQDDAADLYRVMELAYERVKDRIDVSEFYLTGYSLGAWQAAFVAHHDEKARVFDFKKVLMINPPVSLFSSIRILDHMLLDNVPGGMAGLNDFFKRVFNSFVQVYKDHEFTNFGEDFLYRAYTTYEPGDEDLEALIGLSFRMSSNNMAFTSALLRGLPQPALLPLLQGPGPESHPRGADRRGQPGAHRRLPGRFAEDRPHDQRGRRHPGARGNRLPAGGLRRKGTDLPDRRALRQPGAAKRDLLHDRLL